VRICTRKTLQNKLTTIMIKKNLIIISINLICLYLYVFLGYALCESEIIDVTETVTNTEEIHQNFNFKQAICLFGLSILLFTLFVISKNNQIKGQDGFPSFFPQDNNKNSSFSSENNLVQNLDLNIETSMSNIETSMSNIETTSRNISQETLTNKIMPSMNSNNNLEPEPILSEILQANVLPYSVDDAILNLNEIFILNHELITSLPDINGITISLLVANFLNSVARDGYSPLLLLYFGEKFNEVLKQLPKDSLAAEVLKEIVEAVQELYNTIIRQS
jgi:hypothetical protein